MGNCLSVLSSFILCNKKKKKHVSSTVICCCHKSCEVEIIYDEIRAKDFII